MTTRQQRRAAERAARKTAGPTPTPGLTPEGERAAVAYKAMHKHRLAVLPTYDVVDKDMRDLIDSGAEVTCTKGCNACCRHFFYINQVEAMAIIDHAPELVESLMPLIREHERALESIIGVEDLHAAIYTDDTTGALPRAFSKWSRAKVPCVFLGADGLCSVYPVRPLVCRTYYVGSDPALCDGEDEWVKQLDPEGARALNMHFTEQIQARTGFTVLGTLPTMMRVTWELRETLKAHGRHP